MATRSLGTLTVDLLFKLGGFKQGADQATRQFDTTVKKLQRSSQSLIGSFKGFGAALGAGLSIGAIVQATAEAEKAFAQLENAVRQNAGAAGQTAEGLRAISEELQKTTTFSDDAIQGMQALLLRFQSIGPENFERATAAVLDLATAIGSDLQSSARLVGRALEDPAKGMVGLSRAGVIFSAQQKELIKDLASAGETAQAQAIILEGLEKRYEGAAEAARNNFGGALDALRNAFSDLLEAKGGLPDATANLNELTKLLQDPTTKEAVDAITSSLLTLGTTGVKVFVGLFGPIAELIQAAGDLGARIDKALFGREFSPELERRLFSTEGQIEETRKEIEKLQRVKENQPLLFWFNAMNFQLDAANEKLAELYGKLSKGPQTRGGPRGSIIGGPLSQDDLDFLEKLDEDLVTGAEKAQAAIDRLNKIQLKRPDAITDYAKAIAFLNKELADANKKDIKPPKLSEAEREAKSAADSIESFIERLEQQRETLGATEAESLRYAITQGEIADALEKLGEKAGPIREKLLAIADATSEAQATFAIEQQIKALEEQAATLNLTEEEALEYSITQGELSVQLDQAGAAQASLTRRIREATEAVRKAKEEAQRRADIKSIFEETRTDAEKYEAKLKRIAELSKSPDLNAPPLRIKVEGEEQLDEVQAKLDAIDGRRAVATAEVKTEGDVEIPEVRLPGTDIEITVNVVLAGLEQVEEQLESLPVTVASVSVEVNGVQQAQQQLDSLADEKAVEINVAAQGIDEVTRAVRAIPDADVAVNVDSSQIEEVITTVDRATGKTVGFEVRVSGKEELDAVNEQIAAVSDAEATVNVTTTIDTSAVNEALNNLPSTTVPVTVDVETSGVDQIEQRLNSIQDETVAVVMDVDASPIDEVIARVDRATGKTIEFGIRVEGEEELKALNDQIAEVSDAEAVVSVSTDIDTSAVTEAMEKLPTGTVPVTVDVEMEGVTQIEQRLDAIQDESVAVTLDVDASPIEEVITTVDRATGRTVEFGVRVTGQEELSAINDQIAAVSDATATVNVDTAIDTSNVESALRDLPSGTVDVSVEVDADLEEISELQTSLNAIPDEDVVVNVDASQIEEVITTVDRATGRTVEFGVRVSGQEELRAINDQIAAVSDATATVSVETEVDTSAAEEAINNLPSGRVDVVVDVDADLEEIGELQTSLNAIPDEDVLVNVDASQIEEVITTVDRATGRTVEFGVRVSGQEQLQAINDEIAEVSDAEAVVSVTTDVDTSNVREAMRDLPSGTAKVTVALDGVDDVRAQLAAIQDEDVAVNVTADTSQIEEVLTVVSRSTGRTVEFGVNVVGEEELDSVTEKMSGITDKSVTVTVGTEVDTSSVARALENLPSGTTTVDVSVAGMDAVRAEIAAATEALDSFSEETAAAEVTVIGVSGVQAQIAELEQNLATLARASARPGIELEGAEEVRAQIDALLTALRAVAEQQASIGLDVTGVDTAIGQLEALRVSLDTIPETTTAEVQVAVTGAEAASAALEGVSAAANQAVLDQQTLGRAVADAAIEYIDTGDAAADYAARLEEVEERLRAIGASEEAVRAGMDRVEEVFREAGEEASKAFKDEARRNSVGIIAAFLEDPFEDGVKGMLDKFHEMLVQMAAQAVAARIADSLFSGIDGWLSKLGSIFSGGGGGFGSIFGSIGNFFAGLFADGGFIEPGKFGIVGEDGPEVALGGRVGQTILPIQKQEAGDTNVFNIDVQINAPQGTVPRETRQQVAQDIARRVAAANARR